MICTIAGTASAQTLNDYLALRKQNKISKSSPVAALDNFVGSKVLELKCTVKGVMQFDERTSIYVEYPDNRGEQVIDAKEVPAWLTNGPVEARLMVKATRKEEFGAVQVDLIAAASSADVAAYERANAPKVTASDPSYKPIAVKRSTTTSRSGSAKRGIQGDPKIVSIYASFIKNHNKKLTNDRAYEIAEAVIRWSLTYEIDARLVVAVLITESDFNPTCFSSAGAMGLGQLMNENCKEYGINNPYDTNQNLYGTVRQLREHLDRYPGADRDPNKLALALAAYNAGPGAVKKYGGVPPYRETQNYIKRIFSRYRQLCAGD
jgi:soluble lytic murein transglycosylase-like protein